MENKYHIGYKKILIKGEIANDKIQIFAIGLIVWC